MKQPHFSIIIPTLNEEKFLPLLLEDLIHQKERDFEVIVVDGASDDATLKSISRFDKMLNLQFLTVKKRNVAFQRNYGARYAIGEYLVFLDADSRIDHLFTKKLKKEVQTHKHLIFIPLISPQETSYQDTLIFHVVNFLIEVSHKVGNPLSSGGSMIVERNYFRFLKGFNERLFLSEDHDIIKRARKGGVNAYFSKTIKVQFSLRRMKKEGRFDLLRKYIIASLHHFTNEDIDEKIFEYKMGGDAYK